MKKNVTKQSSTLLRACAYGGLATFIVIGLSYALSIIRMCPDGYTQAQVDATGCSIGADIGLGIILLFSPVLLVFAILISYLALLRKGQKKRK